MEVNDKDNKKDIINKNNNSSNDSILYLLNLLSEIPFIKLLPTYTIQDICRLISLKTYKKNEFVLKQGESISNLYIVKSGSFLCTINRLSSSNISHDINSFDQYQNITNEPFIEERKYELKGKIQNNEEISLFIYHKKSFFGDVELVTGKTQSCFSIRANEDDSTLCCIDRNKWIKFTKRLRIPFTRITIDKLNRINERIIEIITRKNKMDIDKMKICRDKINYQIEVNDNYDYCVKKIEEKEEKLEEDLEKYKSNNNSLKLNEKEKSLKNFQNNKQYILDLFKYPNILKEETKLYLKNNLHNSINKKDLRKVKLIKTKSFLDINQDTNKSNHLANNLSVLFSKHSSNNSDFLQLKSRLFLTNSIRSFNKFRNNSMSDIFNSYVKNLKFNNLKELKNTSIISRNKNNYGNHSSTRSMIEPKFKNFNNLIIKNIFNKKNKMISNNSEPINKENKIKKVKILSFHDKNIRNNMIQKYTNKTINNSMYIANKEEKMDLEKINSLLREKYNSSKNNIINKILGKYKANSFFD